MKTKFEKIAKYVIDVLLFFVAVGIIFASYSLIQLSVLHKNYVNYFGYTFFVVESGSMEPSIKTKDMVMVKITDKYKVNDVITYEQDGSFITHRILKTGKNNLLTKGDSNDSEDKLVNRNAVVGKVIKVFSKYGLWKDVILSPIVIIVIFVTLLVFSLGCSFNSKAQRKKELLEYLESDDNSEEKEFIKEEIMDELKEEIIDEIKEEQEEKKEKDSKEKLIDEIKDEIKDELKVPKKEESEELNKKELKEEIMDELKKEILEEIKEESIEKSFDNPDNDEIPIEEPDSLNNSEKLNEEQDFEDNDEGLEENVTEEELFEEALEDEEMFDEQIEEYEEESESHIVFNIDDETKNRIINIFSDSEDTIDINDESNEEDSEDKND